MYKYKNNKDYVLKLPNQILEQKVLEDAFFESSNRVENTHFRLYDEYIGVFLPLFALVAEFFRSHPSHDRVFFVGVLK